MRRNAIMIYGIGGAGMMYRVLRFEKIETEFESHILSTCKDVAADVKRRIPAVEMVFAIDNRYGLKREYLDTVQHPGLESYVAFKDILEREGIRLL